MSSESSKALILPNDILDRILQWTPNFPTLSAAVRVCKAWHAVFQTHPKSIVLAVTENSIGPALPDALRVLRHSKPQEHTDTDELTRAEYKRLWENAAVVKQLEVVFSLRHRDRLSRMSVLTWAESWRFARAMYRIMLYCAAFQMPDDTDGMSELEGNDSVKDRIVADRIGMLQAYSTEELFELNAALVFLRALADEEEDSESVGDTLISTGPASVLEAHRHKERDILVEKIGYTVWVEGPFTLLSGFFATPLQRIWGRRNVAAPPSSESEVLDMILDAGAYQSLPCARCARIRTTKLWDEGTWGGLHLEIRELLPGYLAHNFLEMEPLDEANPSKDIPQLLSELFALRTEDFKEWKKSDSLCDECLTRFVTAHLHLWLLDYRLKDGLEALTDCWYGYDCTIQTHVTLHAMSYNHLCVPTRAMPEEGD